MKPPFYIAGASVCGWIAAVCALASCESDGARATDAGSLVDAAVDAGDASATTDAGDAGVPNPSPQALMCLQAEQIFCECAQHAGSDCTRGDRQEIQATCLAGPDAGNFDLYVCLTKQIFDAGDAGRAAALPADAGAAVNACLDAFSICSG